MNKIIRLLILVGLCSIPSFAATRAFGYCDYGAITVTTNTAVSTTKVMGSFPNCTITVYERGTLTLANIYSDNSGTVQANPFTASNTGYWFFYGSGRFDVRLSNGGILSPFTLGDIKLQDIINVQDYGARCDGITDDTVAIQSAINAGSARQSQVNFPGGVCLASSLNLLGTLRLSGQGPQSSILKQYPNSGTSNQPFITAHNIVDVSLDQLAIDGNYTQQSATNVNAISLINVTNFSADHVQFSNISGSAIFGYGWNNFRVSNSLFINYGYTSVTFPNVGAIQMDYNSATTTSSNLQIFDNIIDGSGAHVGGVKLNGDSTHIFSYIEVGRNIVTVGDANALTGGAALGIELYSNAGIGFFHYSIVGNTIHGETSSSPTTVTSASTWGISVCGAGGQFGSISANTIRWLGAYSIETCGPDISVTGNSLDTTSQIISNNSFNLSGTSVFSNIVISNNTIHNPVGQDSATTVLGVDAIILYTQSGGHIQNVTISGNTIQYLNATAPPQHNNPIHVQCNGGSGDISNVVMSGNSLIGPGSSSSVDGITLEADGTCPVTNTQIEMNTINGFLAGIVFGGDTGSRIINNVYLNVGSKYSGTIDNSTIMFDPQPQPDSHNWPSITPTTNLIFNSSGRYIQLSDGAPTPNVITLNTFNGGSAAIGGIISTNSRQRTDFDTPALGWVQTTSSSLTRALYAGLGACRFSIAFGPATGAGPNPPSDNIEFVAEDNNSQCTGSSIGVSGGVGIGALAVAGQQRIKNFFIGKATVNPGSIAAGTAYQNSVGVTGCNAGDLAYIGFSGLTGTQTLIPFATTSSGSVNYQIYNFGGSPVSLGSGTLTYVCIQSI